MTTNCSSTGVASGYMAVPQKPLLADFDQSGSCTLVRGHGFWKSGAHALCEQPLRVKVCMEFVEGVRRDLPYCGKARPQGSVEKAYLFSQ